MRIPASVTLLTPFASGDARAVFPVIAKKFGFRYSVASVISVAILSDCVSVWSMMSCPPRAMLICPEPRNPFVNVCVVRVELLSLMLMMAWLFCW